MRNFMAIFLGVFLGIVAAAAVIGFALPFYNVWLMRLMLGG